MKDKLQEVINGKRTMAELLDELLDGQDPHAQAQIMNTLWKKLRELGSLEEENCA